MEEFIYNIILVCTRHEELGQCNSDELYKIIEGINPVVIFEEMPPSYFNEYYIKRTRNSLEADTIIKYLETHNVEHIPVDSNNIPSDLFFKDHRYMLERFEGLVDLNSFNYKRLTDEYVTNVEKYGFRYLNSSYCDNLNEQKYDAIEKGLQKINNDKFFQTHKVWNDIHEKRENEMLKNIYSYSKDHRYNRAIFTIGAAHRKSIIAKIQDCEENENVRLKWTFYND